jgi:hypothetical protein
MHWKSLFIGNIVRWDERLWIVAKKFESSLELIKFDGTNITAHPSTIWPENSEHKVDSVRWVADNPKDMLLQVIRGLLCTIGGEK